MLKLVLIPFLLLGLTPLFANRLDITEKKSTEVSVLFAYTKKTAIEAGGIKALKEQVDNGLKLLNEALRNSNTGCKVVAIAQFAEVDYMIDHDNNTMGDLLTELKKKDGQFNKVHQFRKQTKADIICLIYSGNGGGKAYLNGSIMVSSLSSFGGNYIFPHEFGHNLGATHAAGYNFDFGGNFQRRRTVSNNGGVSIPYFSENRTVTTSIKDTKGNTVQKTIKIGDATHDNAATIRKNAPEKALVGDNLKDVPNSNKALSARLVNPMTVVLGYKVKSPYTFKNFTVKQNGKAVDVTFDYECTRIFTEKSGYDHAYRIQPYLATGETDNWNGNTRGRFNAGTQTVKHTFDRVGHEMKEGSYVELQYIKWNKDGSATVKEVVKKIYIGEKINFVEPSDANFITAFTVNEANGDMTIKYKPTKSNPRFKIEYLKPSGGKGSSSGILKGTDTMAEKKGWGEKVTAGTKYTLYIDGKEVKTLTIGTVNTDLKPSSGNVSTKTKNNTNNNTTSITKQKNTLNAGKTLTTDEKMYSPNGVYFLIMQQDGNLCVYKTQGRQFVWCSMAHGFSGAKLVMQTDGNLVVYDGAGTAQWSSKTHPYFDEKFRNTNNKPVKFALEDDGKLHLYSKSGQSVWTNK